MSKSTDVVLYPYDFRRHPQKIEKVDYVQVENDTVACFLSLSNGQKVEGVVEMSWTTDLEVLKGAAYQKAIDNAEKHGYLIQV